MRIEDTTAARGACGGVPERAAVSEFGKAAVEIAQEDEPGSAAFPVVGMAAAQVVREDHP